MTNSIYICKDCQQSFSQINFDNHQLNKISRSNHSLIKHTRIILGLDEKQCVLQSDVDNLKQIINDHLHLDNLSPSQIAKKYNIVYSDFGMFITSSLNLRLKTLKESINNYNNQINRSITNEKLIYWKKCNFNFDVYTEPSIKGFDLIKKYNFSSSSNCNLQQTIQRDHMISIKYGYEHNIPPEHISHPANCEILLSIDNNIKNSNCSITYEDLLDRINNWNNSCKLKELKQTILKSPKSEEHKKNLSKSITEWHKNKRHSYSLEELESMLIDSDIVTVATNLNLSKKQLSDKIRYLRKQKK